VGGDIENRQAVQQGYGAVAPADDGEEVLPRWAFGCAENDSESSVLVASTITST